MKFEKGMKRHPDAGRKKGTPNRKKLQKISEVLADLDIHPAKIVMELLQNGDMRDSDRAKLWLDLYAYCEAKPKEIEAGDEESEADQVLEALRDVTDAKLIHIVKPDGAS